MDSLGYRFAKFVVASVWLFLWPFFCFNTFFHRFSDGFIDVLTFGGLTVLGAACSLLFLRFCEISVMNMIMHICRLRRSLRGSSLYPLFHPRNQSRDIQD